MNNKKAFMGLAVFMLIVASCFVPSVLSENSSAPIQTNLITPFADGDPENMSVTLLAPVLNATIDKDLNVSFTFLPAINGTSQLTGASLWINGSRAEYNQTAIVPWANNTIYHKLDGNGTYLWNIKLENTTDIISATSDYNLTVAVSEPTGISVTLVAPTNGTTVSAGYNVSFTFLPKNNGTDQLASAQLFINNNRVEYNQTKIVADQNNIIYYELPNGTYWWNVRLYNSTNFVTATDNYNFTVAVHTASPTPTPVPTAQPTTIPTSTPHATATPSPTPEPGLGSDLWTLIIVAVIVFSVVLIVAIFLLRRRQ